MRALGLLFACALLFRGALVPAVELTVLDDGSAAQLTTLGNMELGQGRYETAIGHFTKALQVDRGYFWALYNTGLAYQQMGRFDEAGRYFPPALPPRLEGLRLEGLRPEDLSPEAREARQRRVRRHRFR